MTLRYTYSCWSILSVVPLVFGTRYNTTTNNKVTNAPIEITATPNVDSAEELPPINEDDGAFTESYLAPRCVFFARADDRVLYGLLTSPMPSSTSLDPPLCNCLDLCILKMYKCVLFIPLIGLCCLYSRWCVYTAGGDNKALRASSLEILSALSLFFCVLSMV